jgi:inositol-1,3,4-trisphosphate 5/6-kinase/inositol-tetrakisphosphate 1-kinase
MFSLTCCVLLLQEPICGRRKFRVVAPPQVQISEDISLPEAEAMMAASGMTPPMVVKPVWTDGREGSHGLAVVHDMQSLSNLLAGEAGSSVKPPVVIQEFVEHGGVLFKVW